MAMELTRTVEFAMIDLANIAYYPRIFDLAHRFFESTWPEICGLPYHDVLAKRRLGFPVVKVESEFLSPLRYGDTIRCVISIASIGRSSVVWRYHLHNQNGELVWTSVQTTVCVNMDSMDPTELPSDIRTGLEYHIEAEG